MNWNLQVSSMVPRAVLYITSFMMVLLLFLSIEDSRGDDTGSPNMDLPKSIEVGNEISVSVEWSGSVLMEVKYPDTNISWIMEHKEEGSGTFTFILPGPYADGQIGVILHYSSSEDIYAENLTSSDEQFINVSGFTDIDGDGMEDSWEERYDMASTDPEDDKDGDGLSNIDEMITLTNPGRTDTDKDEMLDDWEYFHGTLPFRYDAYGDPDLDEWSNIKEMVNDTDPRNPEDHPEEPPFTPWYWIFLIILVMLLILGYFVKQLFNKRSFEDDMEDFDRKNCSSNRSRKDGRSGKI